MLAITAKDVYIRQALSSLRLHALSGRTSGVLLPLPNSLYLGASSALVMRRVCASPQPVPGYLTLSVFPMQNPVEEKPKEYKTCVAEELAQKYLKLFSFLSCL